MVMDPAKTLEGLSAAATQGELRLYGELDVGLDYEPFFGVPLQRNMRPLQPMTREDQSFVIELWNAYRNGQLIVAQAGHVPSLAAKDAEIARLREALKEMLSVTNEHDDRCSVGALYNCTCDLQAAKEAARQALGDEA